MERGQPTRLAVKRHQHKHNLKHRYEFLETLGKGTYGKVKKALERSTGRMNLSTPWLRRVTDLLLQGGLVGALLGSQATASQAHVLRDL